MLYLDSHYTIGSTHTECQDFTLHDVSPIPHLIVCDGCSASIGSHVGARILAKAAQYLLQQHTIPDYQQFGQYVIDKAKQVVSTMGLPDDVLDSTLVVGFVKDNILTVYMYGDGCILYQKQDDTIGSINIEFADNAPYYLTYWLKEAYQIAYATRGEALLYIDDSLNPQHNPQSFKKSLIYQFPLTEYKTIALTSDGAVSCVNVEIGCKKSLMDVAAHLLNFKTPLADNFIAQRIKTLQQDYLEEHVSILDDLAVAVLTQTDNC